jgi:hypothetical protein
MHGQGTRSNGHCLNDEIGLPFMKPRFLEGIFQLWKLNLSGCEMTASS